MNRHFIALTSALTLLVALAVVAAPAQARMRGPQIDPSTRAEVQGTVVELQTARGEGMPTLVIDSGQGKPMTVRLGPAWYLDKSGFKAAAGDQVHLVTYQCPSSDADAVAGSVENLTNGDTLNLRDDQGVPEWMGSGKGMHGMHGKGMMGRGQGMMGNGQGMVGQGGQGKGPGGGSGRTCPRNGASR